MLYTLVMKVFALLFPQTYAAYEAEEYHLVRENVERADRQLRAMDYGETFKIVSRKPRYSAAVRRGMENNAYSHKAVAARH